MVTELRAVKYFTDSFDQLIKLEILAIGDVVDVNSLTVIGFMNMWLIFVLK